jgi:hypothetical protein
MPTDPKAREAAVFKDLGLAWASNMERPSEAVRESQDLRAQVPLSRLEEELLEAFDTIVLLAAAAKDPGVFSEAVLLDDFLLGPSSADLDAWSQPSQPSQRSTGLEPYAKRRRLVEGPRSKGPKSSCAPELMIEDEC